MAEPVTGHLADLGGSPIPAGLTPELWFVPSSSAASRVTSSLHTGEPIRAALTVSTGAWTAQLEATSVLTGDVRYRPLVKHFRADGRFAAQHYINVDFPVPIGGGSFSSILELPPEPGTVVVDSGPPAPSLSMVLYIDWDDVTSAGVMVYGPGKV